MGQMCVCKCMCMCVFQSIQLDQYFLGVLFRNLPQGQTSFHRKYSTLITYNIVCYFSPIYMCNSKLPNLPTAELISLFSCILALDYKTWSIWKPDNFRGYYATSAILTTMKNCLIIHTKVIALHTYLKYL